MNGTTSGKRIKKMKLVFLILNYFLILDGELVGPRDCNRICEISKSNWIT